MTTALLSAKYQTSNVGPGLTKLIEPAVSPDTANFARRIQELDLSRAASGIHTTPVNDDVNEREQLFDALARAKILTSQVAMHITGDWRRKLFGQLDSLHDPEEWEVGDKPIKQASFATFLKAILAIDPERRPGLGLSYSGHLIAAWVTGDDRLTIEFLPEDRVRWVLSLKSADGVVRYAGDTPVGVLLGDLSKHNPKHWFSK